MYLTCTLSPELSQLSWPFFLKKYYSGALGSDSVLKIKVWQQSKQSDDSSGLMCVGQVNIESCIVRVTTLMSIGQIRHILPWNKLRRLVMALRNGSFFLRMDQGKGRLFPSWQFYWTYRSTAIIISSRNEGSTGVEVHISAQLYVLDEEDNEEDDDSEIQELSPSDTALERSYIKERQRVRSQFLYPSPSYGSPLSSANTVFKPYTPTPSVPASQSTSTITLGAASATDSEG